MFVKFTSWSSSFYDYIRILETKKLKQENFLMLCWVVWKLLYATFHIRPFWSLIIQEKSDIFTVDNYEGVKTNRIYQVIQWGLRLLLTSTFFLLFDSSSVLSSVRLMIWNWKQKVSYKALAFKVKFTLLWRQLLL